MKINQDMWDNPSVLKRIIHALIENQGGTFLITHDEFDKLMYAEEKILYFETLPEIDTLNIFIKKEDNDEQINKTTP